MTNDRILTDDLTTTTITKRLAREHGVVSREGDQVRISPKEPDRCHAWTAALGIAATVLLVPTLARADGGGPLLLIFGLPAFLFGQIWIILSEWLVQCYVHPVRGRSAAFGDAVVVNLRSMLAVSAGILGLSALPFAVMWLFPMTGYPVLRERVEIALFVLGGWVGGEMPQDQLLNYLSPAAFLGWFVASYFLTVYCEARVLRKRGQRDGLVSTVSPLRLSWITNSLSYVGLVVSTYALFTWLD